MKKHNILILLLIGVFSFGNNISAQAVSKGNVLINGYYGGPNTSIILMAFSGGTGETSSFFGPLGGQVGYMVGDKFSIGLDINYTDNSVSWTGQDLFTSNMYNYTVGFTTLRVMPRFDFHFGDSESFDMYFGVGTGWRSKSWAFESNQPDYDPGTFESLNPIAFRLALGGSYYFTDNIGLNLELGLGGGGLARGGIAFKL